MQIWFFQVDDDLALSMYTMFYNDELVLKLSHNAWRSIVENFLGTREYMST